jgi:hypothetical protein
MSDFEKYIKKIKEAIPAPADSLAGAKPMSREEWEEFLKESERIGKIIEETEAKES